MIGWSQFKDIVYHYYLKKFCVYIKTNLIPCKNLIIDLKKNKFKKIKEVKVINVKYSF